MKKETLKLLALLLTFALALLAFTACGDNSSSTGESGSAESSVTTENEETPAEPATLKVGLMGTGIKPVGTIVANALGYFEEEGVDVEFQKVSSMNDAYMAVSTGDLDVYLFSSTAAATFISQGTTTLRVFGGTAGEGSEIMAPKGSGISLKSADDFKGLTVGCFMAETGQMVLKNWLLEQGLTIGGPDDNPDVVFIYYSDTSSGIEACKNGDYDIVLTNSSLGYYADDYGVDVVANVSDFVPVYPCCRQTCYQGTYESNPEALKRFEIAALRGFEYAKAHEEETLDILEEYSGEDREYLRAQIYGTESYTPAMRIVMDPDKDAVVAFYEAMENIGEIEDRVEVNWPDYVVTDIYEGALSALSEREPDNSFWQELMDYFRTHNTI